MTTTTLPMTGIFQIEGCEEKSPYDMTGYIVIEELTPGHAVNHR
jgi:hypothetical protein